MQATQFRQLQGRGDVPFTGRAIGQADYHALPHLDTDRRGRDRDIRLDCSASDEGGDGDGVKDHAEGSFRAA
jgi:hypothetical protein